MRPRETSLLVGVLVRFLTRRVLSIGLLRTTAVRWALLLVGVIAQVGLTAVSVLALEELFVERDTLRLLLESAALTAGFATLIAFVFVKLMFLKSSTVLNFTRQLPTTDRERSTALLVFEALMVLVATGALLAPLTTASTIVVGADGVTLVLAAVVYPTLLFYLCLALGYNLLVRFLLLTGWVRAAQLVASTAFAVLIFVYQGQTGALIERITGAYLADTTAHTGINAFLVLADTSATLATLVFLTATAVLVGLVVVTAPALPLSGRRYLRVPVRGIGDTRLAVYLAAALRRWETLFAAVLAFATAGYLVATGSEVIAFASGLLLFECIFAYVASRPIFGVGHLSDGVGKRLGMMLAAQAVTILLLSAPISLAALALGNAPATIGQFYAAAASAVVVLIFIGIALPPEKDNPFSVFLGLLLAAVIVSMVLLMTGLLAMPVVALVLLLVVGHAALVFYSYVGIRSLERQKRHEAARILG